MPRAVDLSDKTSSTSNIVRTGCQNSNSTKVKRSICEVSTFHQRVVPSRDPDKRTHTQTRINTAVPFGLFYVSDLSCLPYGRSAQCLEEFALRWHLDFPLLFVGSFICVSACRYTSVQSQSRNSLLRLRSIHLRQRPVCLPVCLSVCLALLLFKVIILKWLIFL